MRALRMAGLVVALGAFLIPADNVEGQLSDPCEIACAATLGASSFVFAMGTMAVVGRLEGGYTTKTGPAVTFAGAFVASVGTGLALSGNGDRQRRAVYGSAIGAAGGALAGLVAESLIGESDTASRFAATLVGGALGVVAGGIVGASTYDGVAGQRPTFTVVSPPLPIPFAR